MLSEQYSSCASSLVARPPPAFTLPDSDESLPRDEYGTLLISTTFFCTGPDELLIACGRQFGVAVLLFRKCPDLSFAVIVPWADDSRWRQLEYQPQGLVHLSRGTFFKTGPTAASYQKSVPREEVLPVEETNAVISVSWGMKHFDSTLSDSKHFSVGYGDIMV